MTNSQVDMSSDREALLDAAERLFYGRGIQSVGMDRLRTESGLSLKRIYALYPAKQELVVAFLARRDVRWRGRLFAHARAADQPLTAVFDWLEQWFGESDFRGCAWINAYGELGATSSAVAQAVREHKAAFRADLAGLVAAAGMGDEVVDDLYLLIEGAIVTAGIVGETAPARQAKTAAERLLSR
jgi:AcrR family transcriptional regulator